MPDEQNVYTGSEGRKPSLFLPPLALRFAAKEDAPPAEAGRRLRVGKSAMGSFSIWHWMLFIAVALLLFGGKGKISDIMGDVAKGVKSFKKGMSDDDEEKPAPTVVSSAPRTIENRVGVDANDVHKVG
jgi:sec-independent protein translocase protein TatA